VTYLTKVDAHPHKAQCIGVVSSAAALGTRQLCFQCPDPGVAKGGIYSRLLASLRQW